MDFKTYCDTVFRNFLIDSNIPVENVVMPDIYVQFLNDNEIITDGDYLKPYNFIVPLYNDALVIDESKMYFESMQGIMLHSLLSGNFAEKDTSISFENYCAIAQKLI